MQRKVLVATVAAAPLLAMAFGAYAETVVNTARTTPIATATATTGGTADDVKIDAAGSVKLTAAGAIVTLNSNNKVTNAGTIATTGVNDSIGIMILGGTTGTVTNSAAINLSEDYTPTDTDSDGDLDGLFATGQNRYGILLDGPGVFTGDIVQEAAGSIIIEGNNSAAIWLKSGLVGNLKLANNIAVTGNNSYGLRIDGPVTGKVTNESNITVSGANAVGIAVNGAINGAFVVQSSVATTGYRYTSRPTSAAQAAILDADDLLQGGSAVQVTANVTGGILLDAPPVDASSTNTDEDSDGVADSAEGTASLTTFGAAPALLIGSNTNSVAVGAVGAGDKAYGLISRGSIVSNGVYDGVSSTAVQLGGDTGQTAALAGGMRLDSATSATAYDTRQTGSVVVNATGVLLKAGASAPTIWNRGPITATTVAENASDARGVVIEAGASATTLRNAGSISATVGGEKGSAYGILDRSGSLTTIENTGKIIAAVVATDDADDADDADFLTTNEVVTGKAVAIDVAANTTGVTLTQNGLNDGDDGADGVADTDTDGDGVDDADEPSLFGAIRFGSGADTFNVLNGTVSGDISFGAGADRLNISGGAFMAGALSDSGGDLAISLGSGVLNITNSETINITSLDIASTGKLVFTADPAAGTATKLVASGAVNIVSGASLGLRLTSLLKDPKTYTVITGGSLTAGAINQDLLGNAPYLYKASSRTDANNAYIDVRRRTAAEIGMSRSQASAYDAVVGALGQNTDLASAFLRRNDRDTFLEYYNQMLPDQGEGLFSALASANQQISAATAMRPDPGDRYGPDSIWVQELNTLVRRDSDATLGSDTQALGFVGGYEAMGDAGGALGLTLAFVSVEEHDIAAKVGEQTSSSFLQGGAYWRRAVGGWRMNAGGGGGYGWFEGDRRFIAGDDNADGAADLILKNSAKWNGATANAFAGLGYEAKFGRFYARPEARFDYLWMREGERKEAGGGAGFDLLVDERTSSNLSGEAGVAFGADFGSDVWWRPEVRVGYRQTIAGEVGDTIARFTGGNPFTLAALDDKQGALTLGFAVRAGTPMSYLALEGSAEATKRQKKYNVRLIGRAMF